MVKQCSHGQSSVATSNALFKINGIYVIYDFKSGCSRLEGSLVVIAVLMTLRMTWSTNNGARHSVGMADRSHWNRNWNNNSDRPTVGQRRLVTMRTSNRARMWASIVDRALWLGPLRNDDNRCSRLDYNQRFLVSTPNIRSLSRQDQDGTKGNNESEYHVAAIIQV